jgi:hypothetical protein
MRRSRRIIASVYVLLRLIYMTAWDFVSACNPSPVAFWHAS